MNKGKIPPQATDIEDAVLGSMMIDSSSLTQVMDFITPNIFYNEKNKLIFESIENIYAREEAIDIMTVSNELKKNKSLEKIGGDYHLVQLTQKISSSANIEYHSRILLQKFIQRQLISNSSSIIEKAYDDGVDSLDLLDKAYDHLAKVSDLIINNKEVDLKELTAEIIEHGGKLFRGEVEAGIPTPIKNLTNRMGGWRDGELIIIAARPGMGKTAFALKSGWIAALSGMPVGFFSLEMSSTRLLSRLWSMDCHIDGEKFTKTGLSPDEQQRILARSFEFEEIPFYIDDTEAMNLQTLKVKAKKLKKDKGIKMIILDYLQLMSGTGGKGNREQEISKISRGLKILSKELDIPVIALSQLSRAVETRGGSKRPLLSDLRESGAIEQDADVVKFIYRPEYYGEEFWDDYDGAPCKNEAEYIIAKNRNGSLVRNRMKFEGRYTDFTELEDYDNEIPKQSPEEAFNDNDDSPF